MFIKATNWLASKFEKVTNKHITCTHTHTAIQKNKKHDVDRTRPFSNLVNEIDRKNTNSNCEAEILTHEQNRFCVHYSIAK